MAWNWLDIVVLLLAIGQIGVVVAIVVIAGRIRRGAIARFSVAIGRNITTGKKLVATAKTAGEASLPHAVGIYAALSRVPRSLRAVRLDDAPVTYGSLLRNVGAWQLLRGSLSRRTGGSRVRRSPRVGFAEKAGLIPPAWKKVAPLWGYAGIALSVWQEVQKQLPQIRRAIAERTAPKPAAE